MSNKKVQDSYIITHHTGICTNCFHNKYIVKCKLCNKYHTTDINKYCSECGYCCRNDFYDVCGLHNKTYTKNNFKIDDLKDVTLCTICKEDLSAYMIDCPSCDQIHSKFILCQSCKYCKKQYNIKHKCSFSLCDKFWYNFPIFCKPSLDTNYFNKCYCYHSPMYMSFHNTNFLNGRKRCYYCKQRSTPIYHYEPPY